MAKNIKNLTNTELMSAFKEAMNFTSFCQSYYGDGSSEYWGAHDKESELHDELVSRGIISKCFAGVYR